MLTARSQQGGLDMWGQGRTGNGLCAKEASSAGHECPFWAELMGLWWKRASCGRKGPTMEVLGLKLSPVSHLLA